VLVLLLPLTHSPFAGAFFEARRFSAVVESVPCRSRALLAERQSAYERREVIISYRSEFPCATEWRFDVKEHTAGRVISIPPGMTLESGLRALGGFSERELARAAELHPDPLQMGTMLMLRR
jgi:hypothetical protein